MSDNNENANENGGENENEGSEDQNENQSGGDGGDDNASDLYRPEGLAEQYFGDDNNATIDNLKKAVDGFRKQQGKHIIPENAAGYELKMDEELQGRMLKVGEDGTDPFFEAVKGMAHKAGMSQDMFGAFIPEIMAAADGMFGGGEDTGDSDADMDFDFKTMGGAEAAKPLQDDALARIDGLAAQGKIKDETVLKEMKTMVFYGNGLATVRAFLEISGEEVIPTKSGNNAAQNGLTEEKLQEMLRDERYWKDKEPAFIKEVTEGFAALYN